MSETVSPLLVVISVGVTVASAATGAAKVKAAIKGWMATGVVPSEAKDSDADTEADKLSASRADKLSLIETEFSSRVESDAEFDVDTAADKLKDVEPSGVASAVESEADVLADVLSELWIDSDVLADVLSSKMDALSERL